MTPVNVFNYPLVRDALGEAEHSDLARTFDHVAIAASRHDGFIPFVRRLKRCTSRDKAYRQKQSVRSAAQDIATDFAPQFHSSLDSFLDIPQ
jgi:hypothetical protein